MICSPLIMGGVVVGECVGLWGVFLAGHGMLLEVPCPSSGFVGLLE